MQKPINRKTIFSDISKNNQKFKKVSRIHFDRNSKRVSAKKPKPKKIHSKTLPKKLQIFHCSEFKASLEKLIKELTARKFELELFNVTQTQDQLSKSDLG